MVDERLMKLYICDPSKNTKCKKGRGCQRDCFYSSNPDARADVFYIQNHLINLLMDAYPDHKIIIKKRLFRK